MYTDKKNFQHDGILTSWDSHKDVEPRKVAVLCWLHLEGPVSTFNHEKLQHRFLTGELSRGSQSLPEDPEDPQAPAANRDDQNTLAVAALPDLQQPAMDSTSIRRSALQTDWV